MKSGKSCKDELRLIVGGNLARPVCEDLSGCPSVLEIDCREAPLT